VPHRVPAVLSRESCALRAQIVALCSSPTWRRGQAWGTVKTLLASEDSLFKARATARRSQISLLQSKISQLGEEISGLDAPVASKTRQLELITGELSGVQELCDKRLVPLARSTGD